MSPRPAPYSTFSASRGASQDQNTPLAPFWDKSAARFWTSAQIKDSAASFGYAYPETQKWRYASTAAYQTALRQTVTGLYGSNVFANFVSNVASRQPPAGVAAAKKSDISLAALSLAASPKETEKEKAVAAQAAAAKKENDKAQKPIGSTINTGEAAKASSMSPSFLTYPFHLPLPLSLFSPCHESSPSVISHSLLAVYFHRPLIPFLVPLLLQQPSYIPRPHAFNAACKLTTYLKTTQYLRPWRT